MQFHSFPFEQGLQGRFLWHSGQNGCTGRWALLSLGGQSLAHDIIGLAIPGGFSGDFI